LTDPVDKSSFEETEDAVIDAPAFLGDTGALPLDTRRVLVQLLLGPSVDARRQSKLWPVLLRDEVIIRSRMHELFLEVVIDHDQRVAFTRQVVDDEIDVPVLLRKASLTFLETVLILFLRQRLTQADAQGERAVVSLGEMQEHLSVFAQESNSDYAKFERQMLNSVEKAKKLSLLRFIRGSGERYEVSPTLKLLFSAEQIQDLMRTYAGLRNENAGVGASLGVASDENETERHVDDDNEDVS